MTDKKTAGEALEQYLVGRRSDAGQEAVRDLLEFRSLIRATPGARILKDDDPKPRRLVVEMSSSVAEDMKKRFRERLTIEPNAPLRHLSDVV